MVQQLTTSGPTAAQAPGGWSGAGDRANATQKASNLLPTGGLDPVPGHRMIAWQSVIQRTRLGDRGVYSVHVAVDSAVGASAIHPPQQVICQDGDG